jgi:PD-(D/E)XK nuclease superfamily
MTSAPTVRWRPEVAIASTWSQLRPVPEINGGFIEARPYIFEKPGREWVLRIDDEPLPDTPDPGYWGWTPRFFAGEVMAELVGPRNSLLFAIDVAPDPGKIGREMFGRMVDELWAEDPVLVIGSEPATRHVGDLGTIEDPWLEFARFRRYVPEYLQAIAAVRARPRRSLRIRRTSLPLHQARRVDRRTAAALSTSAAGVILGLAEGDAVPLVEHRLDVPLIEETLDSAANRAILALTLRLLRRARALHDRLEQRVQRERASDTETPLANRWPVRSQVLVELAGKLKLMTRLSPFADARRPEITAAGLTAIAADPAYARMWNRGWRALRHGIESPPTTERLWMSPSWQIYERWCLLRLGRLLMTTFPTWRFCLDVKHLSWSGESGTKRAFLEYQQRFGSLAEGPTRWSVSKQREPDLLLTVVDSDTGDIRFIVFDAKYRASRANVLDAMTSAHVYQDSLRVGQRRAEASFLLVPSGGGAPRLEEPGFHAEHKVGVVPCAPESIPAFPRVVLDQFGI